MVTRSQGVASIADRTAASQGLHCESENRATFIFTVTLANVGQFLADRTNGRAIGTLLRSSSVVVVVCDVILWLNGAS